MWSKIAAGQNQTHTTWLQDFSICVWGAQLNHKAKAGAQGPKHHNFF